MSECRNLWLLDNEIVLCNREGERGRDDEKVVNRIFTNEIFFMIHVYEINRMYFHFLSVGIRVE